MWRDDLKITANGSGLPSDRHPDRVNRAVVLGAVKVWPGKGRACRKAGATANLDSSCARRPERSAGRDEETGLRSNKETDERTKDALPCRNSLTGPIQETLALQTEVVDISPITKTDSAAGS
jgi:hypothetical protein